MTNPGKLVSSPSVDFAPPIASGATLSDSLGQPSFRGSLWDPKVRSTLSVDLLSSNFYQAAFRLNSPWGSISIQCYKRLHPNFSNPRAYAFLFYVTYDLLVSRKVGPSIARQFIL